MTTKEIDKALTELRKRDRATLTDDEKLLEEELECRSMINSILCYCGGLEWAWRDFTKKRKSFPWMPARSYADDYIDVLGEDKVKKLFDEQKDYFENHVTIKRNVYTDSEGCSYNSLVEN